LPPRVGLVGYDPEVALESVDAQRGSLAPVAETSQEVTSAPVVTSDIGEGLGEFIVYVPLFGQHGLVDLDSHDLADKEVVGAKGQTMGDLALEGDRALGDERRADLVGRGRGQATFGPFVNLPARYLSTIIHHP
jgi:hypothetical protein